MMGQRFSLHNTLTSHLPFPCYTSRESAGMLSFTLPSAISVMAEFVLSCQGFFSFSFVTARGRRDSAVMRDGSQKLGH